MSYLLIIKELSCKNALENENIELDTLLGKRLKLQKYSRKLKCYYIMYDAVINQSDEIAHIAQFYNLKSAS